MYYRPGDWESAIHYLTILNNVPETYSIPMPKYHVQNTMAFAYRKPDKYDSSEYISNASYQSALAIKDSFGMALTLGNLGYKYYLKGDIGKAEPLLEDDYAVNRKAGEKKVP